jgi:hypothetical protein
MKNAIHQIMTRLGYVLSDNGTTWVSTSLEVAIAERKEAV